MRESANGVIVQRIVVLLRQPQQAVVFVCSKGGGAYGCIHVVCKKGVKIRDNGPLAQKGVCEWKRLWNLEKR